MFHVHVPECLCVLFALNAMCFCPLLSLDDCPRASHQFTATVSDGDYGANLHASSGD